MPPDREMIAWYVNSITAPWTGCSGDSFLELRCFADNRTPNIARFKYSEISETVAHAGAMNEQGLNIYTCVNPVNPGDASSSKAASDQDIRHAVFVFADCDEPGIAEQIPEIAPPHDLRVVTGIEPHLRCHYYRQLEEPLCDLIEWKTVQKKLAAKYGTDPAIWNPSRLMRVGGTISYPDHKKQERGYINELTWMKQG